MKWLRLKYLLFNLFSYLLINICLLLSTGIQNCGGGDECLWIVFAMMLIGIQFFVGVILSIIFSFTNKNIHFVFKILVYVIINSFVVLSFIYTDRKGYYHEYIYLAGSVLILGSFIYGFLLKKYFNSDTKLDGQCSNQKIKQ